MKKPDKSSARRLRAIPAVEKVLQALEPLSLPRPAAVAVVRRALSACRASSKTPGFEQILHSVRLTLQRLQESRIQPVINGTGILIHTNLGRAPLGPEVLQTLAQVGANYSNLEYDIGSGERGSRGSYLEHNLALLCGAEAATVVNNCAAALVLTLRHFVRQKPEVIISRGELVQIGGGFRIPDILEASGARLREVGTTNRTSLSDYAAAIGPSTALILKVHRSNFFMGGFVESPTTEEIAKLARQRRVPFVEDLGSGAMVATEKLGLAEHEPTPSEVLRRGVDLVTFSGDKLLGGPQAGIIAGKAKRIASLKREPFFRALRCDKLILSALETTVDLYLNGTAEKSIPILDRLRCPESELCQRAEQIVTALDGSSIRAKVGLSQAQIGGGTLPRSNLSSITVDLLPAKFTLKEFASRLRAGSPPVIGCISGGVLKVHLRTVFPNQDPEVARAIRAASESTPSTSPVKTEES